METNKIHIAYGFHVNCYHSYRGDSNDNLGFGSDIRIIGKTLDALTKCNEQGIPVKGTWDSENFFSLEKILPEYAPEIIENMKYRVEKYGDENIIMGYSNGALSAMNEEEFEASIEKAVSNAEGSGLQDIFGTFEKLVRPQEVMFTPSQVSLYNKLGVKALCLYYSCVPFDAFRTIIKPLPDELAFNPLTYTYKGESMTIIPTYSNADICDAGCLRKWVKELHKKQVEGTINHDLLLFINMDADAAFWEDFELPFNLANARGIDGLVREVADLEFVVFDTPGNYIKTHENLGEITFTQDTADGNFTGYASWSEKPYNRKIWTAIERSRAMAKVNAKTDFESPSFRERVLLLSTTHFGLATPVLNIQREKKADKLAKNIVEAEKLALPQSKKLTIHNITNSTTLSIQLKLNCKIRSVSQLQLSANGLLDYAIMPMSNRLDSVFLFLKFEKVQKKYTVEVKISEEISSADIPNVLGNDNLRLHFGEEGQLELAEVNGKTIGKKSFLQSFITYDDIPVYFSGDKVLPLDCGGSGKGIRIHGEMVLPNGIERGHFTFDFFETGFSDGVFVRTDVKYPYTPEDTSISTENSALGRYSDMRWKEVAMFQLTPKLKGDIRVLKRNFMDDISSFRAQSLPESNPKNKKVASFNHQLSAGLVGLTDGESGLIVANARQVLNSMAHCPMRLDEDKTVHMNPFGTYFGKQRNHWSRAKGEIFDTYTLIAPQGKSIAPSYNGNQETALLGLFGFSGEMPEENQLQEIISFADGAVASAGDTSPLLPFFDDNVKIKKAKSDGISERKLQSPLMTGFRGNLKKYIVNGTRAIMHIIRSQRKAK